MQSEDLVRGNLIVPIDFWQHCTFFFCESPLCKMKMGCFRAQAIDYQVLFYSSAPTYSDYYAGSDWDSDAPPGRHPV